VDFERKSDSGRCAKGAIENDADIPPDAAAAGWNRDQPTLDRRKGKPAGKLARRSGRKEYACLNIGTSSDRIGTPSGQSFYATASKNLKRETGLPIAPYFGIAYGTYEHKLRPIGGLSIGFTESLTSLVIFDGVHVNPTLNWSYKRSVFWFLLVNGHEPGVGYSITF
jgi:hypothetical protein